MVIANIALEQLRSLKGSMEHSLGTADIEDKSHVSYSIFLIVLHSCTLVDYVEHFQGTL
jgi:hypothetical protein